MKKRRSSVTNTRSLLEITLKREWVKNEPKNIHLAIQETVSGTNSLKEELQFNCPDILRSLMVMEAAFNLDLKVHQPPENVTELANLCLAGSRRAGAVKVEDVIYVSHLLTFFLLCVFFAGMR